MTTKTIKTRNAAFDAILSAATGLHRAGAIDKATMREFDSLCLESTPVFKARDIKRIRESTRVSQTVFARYLNTSARNEQRDALGLLNAKRGSWTIESALNYRLDDTLDEDESRVCRESAAHILGMGRQLVVGFACAWLRKAQGTKKNCRKSTRDF